MSGDVLIRKSPLNPSALSIDDAARVLTAAGNVRIAPELIAADVDSGAPVNADGTLNLAHYAAWLVKELAGRDD